MDRSLDDRISDRQQSGNRGQRDRRPPRDGVRKPVREDNKNLDREWIHDRYEDSDDYGRPVRGSSSRQQRNGGRSPPPEIAAVGAKLKVENLHYDITERELSELFERKGRVLKVQLIYDRHDRSEGVAFVTYEDQRDAEDAIKDFNGANAHGQPIRISLLRNPAPRAARNPFDTAERPSRSLFERIEGGRRGRSDSPERNPRRDNVRRPTPEGVDRYVPGANSRGGRDGRDRRERGPRRSPLPRREGGGDRDSRRPGDRRRREPEKDDGGHRNAGGRPRKTAEELDAEMNDYWGKSGEASANGSTQAAAPAAPAPADDDIDMIE